jgi:hypothetical protein
VTDEPLSCALRLVGTRGPDRWSYVFFVARYPEHLVVLGEQLAHLAAAVVGGHWDGWAWEVETEPSIAKRGQT